MVFGRCRGVKCSASVLQWIKKHPGAIFSLFLLLVCPFMSAVFEVSTVHASAMC